MTMPPDTDTDAWTVEDPCACPVCGRDACEDHFPVDNDLPPRPNGRDHEAETAEARAARRTILTGQEVDKERMRREARRIVDAEERGPIIEPVSYRLRDWLTEPDPEAVRWRISGWQPADSRVILAAARKTGKTTMVGSLVRSLLDGDLFLGAATVTPVTGIVGLFDTEMADRQLRCWYRDQGVVHDDRLVVFPLRGQARSLNLLDPACRTRWADRLRGVSYLIVDNLRPILDAIGLDESKDAGRWLVEFDALLREAAIPDACVVHHMGHNGERSRGDSRLRDWPDVEWRMMRQTDDDASPRFIAAYGRDVDVPESQLAYDRVSRRLSISGGSRGHARVVAALEAVCEALRTSPEPLTGRGVVEALDGSGHARDTIYVALSTGVRDGRLIAGTGPKRSKQYRVSECPGVSGSPSGHSPTDRVSECPDDYIESDTPDTPVLPLADGDVLKTSPDTRRRRTARSGAAATRNTPRTRRRARQEDL